jgi:hypothetical protein
MASLVLECCIARMGEIAYLGGSDPQSGCSERVGACRGEGFGCSEGGRSADWRLFGKTTSISSLGSAEGAGSGSSKVLLLPGPHCASTHCASMLCLP